MYVPDWHSVGTGQGADSLASSGALFLWFHGLRNPSALIHSLNKLLKDMQETLGQTKASP